MAYDDEYADILGGPILQNPNSAFLGKWSQCSIFFRAGVIIALGLFASLFAVRTWGIWKKSQELGYRKAMRRKHGIPDSDCRPFAVAYAAATRARGEREANKLKLERPVTDHPVSSSDTHGLRRRAAEPASKPHLYQQSTTRRSNAAGHDYRPNGFDFAQRYNPRLRDGVLSLAGESLSPGSRLLHPRAGRKDLVLDANAAVEGKKRAFNDDDILEPEISKKSRVDGRDLIDGDEEPEWYEEEEEVAVQPTQRGSKRTFDSDEEDDYIRTDGRDKRPRNMSRVHTPEDQEMEDIEDDDVAELERIPRGKKRDRAEAASTFGGDDGEEMLDDRDDKTHRHRKRRTVQSRKSDISSRGSKPDRDPELPGGESAMGTFHKHEERTSKKKKGKKISSGEVASDVPDSSHDPLCGSRKVGEEWESNGVQYRVGSDGQRLRLTLVKKARSRYSMPRDSQHPDKQANMEIYVETWLTDEQHKHAEERQELVWQETPRVSIEPSTPNEVSGSPIKTGKDLLWDSMKSSPRRTFRQSLADGSAKMNPFQQPLPQVTTRRRVASSNSHPPSLVHGVAEVSSRPGFRAFSKWEKQDLEAEAMARMRARMLEQKKAETPSKICEISASATAPELGLKNSAIPIITFTPPPPTTSTVPAPLATEAKPAQPTFSFGPTSSSTDASKTTAITSSNAPPVSVAPTTPAPAANTRSLLPTSTQQTMPATQTFSFTQPTTQLPATGAVPTTTSAPSTSTISSFFKPTVPSSSATPSFSFGPTSAPSTASPATAAPSTTPSFSFAPTPVQPQIAISTTSSMFPAPVPSNTETNKPAAFTFAKPNAQSSATSSISTPANPPSISTPSAPPSATVPASTQSAPAPLKFDFGRKTNSTTTKPVVTSSTPTAADPSKAPFSFSMTPQASTSETSSPQTFSFGQSSSTAVFGPGSTTATAPKPAETTEGASKTAASEPEKPKFSFATAASSAPKSTFSFSPQSGTSAFATVTPGSDTKKDSPLSIFGAAKEDGKAASVFGGSSFSGASSNISHQDASKPVAPSPASVFGSSSFGTNGVFGKSSAPSQSGDASMSTSAPKNVFGNGVANNPVSTTPAGSPATFGSTQPSASPFGNGSAKLTDSSKPSPFGVSANTTSVFSFGKKDDTTMPSSSGVSTSSSPFSFQKPVFGEPSSSSSNGPTQPQSMFSKPSTPTPSAFGFGSGTGTGTGNGSTFTFGGQSGGQNQQQ